MIPLASLLTFRQGQEPVATLNGATVLFAQFRTDVVANSERIAASGCRRGLLAADDAYRAAVGLFAILHAGAEAVLPPNTLPGTITAMIEDGDLVVTDTVAGLSRGLVLVSGEPAFDRPMPPLAGDAKIRFFTSGSSGERKPVLRTLAGLGAEVAAVDPVLASYVAQTATIRGSVSHQHVYGLLFRILWPLSTGRTFDPVLYAHWETVLHAIAPGDMLLTGPAHLARLQGIPPLPAGSGPALVLSAGAPLADAAADDARRILGTAPLEILGSTETGAAAHRRRDRPDPPWHALPTLTIARADDGSMRVAGPQVEGSSDGWLVTADRIEPHGDGFRFLGRSDRIEKVEGKRVSLPELEAALRGLEWVEDAAAFVLDEERPRLAAAIVPNAAGRALRETAGEFRLGRLLRSSLGDRFEAAALPRRWRFVDLLPADPMGKRSSADLARLFVALPPASPPSIWPTMPELRGLVRGEGMVTLDLWMPPDLAQLDGHFPGRPIVPGVAQLDWAVKLAARHLGTADAPARRFQVKFRRVMVPDTTVRLLLREDPARSRLIFEYRDRHGNDVLTSGSIRRDAT